MQAEFEYKVNHFGCNPIFGLEYCKVVFIAAIVNYEHFASAGYKAVVLD